MNRDDEIRLREWWMGELKKITGKLMEQEEKRQGRSSAKADKALADFRNRDEILDAYGFGCITEKQKDRLMDLWDRRERETEPDRTYQLRIGLLQEFYQLAKDIIRNNGGEVST